MSKLSIYENSWLNLVFEGKNKAYGAYLLRQKSDETTLLAFCIALFFVAASGSIFIFASHLNPNQAATLEEEIFQYPILQISDYQPNKPHVPVKKILPITKKQPANDSEKEKLINPIIVSPKEATPNTATNTEAQKPSATSSNAEGTIATVNSASTSPGTGTETEPNSDGTTVNLTFSLDKLPEYPGGMNKFYDYVGHHFEKLEIEETMSVIISFVIETDGSMTDIKVLRSSTPAIEKESIRVLQSLKTKWKPGYKNGQPVRTLYKLPIKVKP